jgi:hypothetical protein
MWRYAHIGIIASLLVTFAQAPFQHSHDHHPNHVHAHGLNLAHFADHHVHDDADHHADEAGQAFDHPDEASSARLQDWLAVDGKAHPKLDFELPVAMVSPLLVIQTMIRERRHGQGHDPPWRASLHPRAPPA